MQALSHRSFVNEASSGDAGHNERLEFLGDAVLDLIVADRLMTHLPDDREGRLSRLRSLIVSETTLAQVANEISLGRYMRLGKGEEQSGGREKPSLLANTFEALVGAIYIDGGFAGANRVVGHLLEKVIEQAITGKITQDYKSRLQELIQARERLTPRYDVVLVSGPDHAKVFEVAVFSGENELARGTGSSKKEAEQMAAEQALEQVEDGVETTHRKE